MISISFLALRKYLTLKWVLNAAWQSSGASQVHSCAHSTLEGHSTSFSASLLVFCAICLSEEKRREEKVKDSSCLSHSATSNDSRVPCFPASRHSLFWKADSNCTSRCPAPPAGLCPLHLALSPDYSYQFTNTLSLLPFETTTTTANTPSGPSHFFVPLRRKPVRELPPTFLSPMVESPSSSYVTCEQHRTPVSCCLLFGSQDSLLFVFLLLHSLLLCPLSSSPSPLPLHVGGVVHFPLLQRIVTNMLAYTIQI